MIPGTYYEGRPSEPLYRANVCRIYLPGQDPIILAKCNAVPKEEQPYIRTPPECYNSGRIIWKNNQGKIASINVFICLDYLIPYTEETINSVNGQRHVIHKSELDWENDGINIVLMDTRETDLFVGQAGFDVRRMRGPGKLVALCAAAGRGNPMGSTLLAPASPEFRVKGDIVGTLKPDEEALLMIETKLTDIQVTRTFPRTEQDEPIVRPPIIGHFFDDGERLNIDWGEERAFERGVWHPALLEVLHRQLYTDFHVVREWKRIREVFINEEIKFVTAFTVRGEHDLVLRRYASKDEHQTNAINPLPIPYSHLSDADFHSLFERRRSARLLTEPADILRYRFQDVDFKSWNIRKTRIAAMVGEAQSNGTISEILMIIHKLSKNWFHPDISLEDRAKVADAFMEDTERMAQLNAGGSNSLNEVFILVSAIFGGEEKERLESDIIRGKLKLYKEIRSIYRVRAVNANLTQFDYILDIIATPNQVNKIIMDIRSWSEDAAIKVGTRTIEMMELLEADAVGGLWIDQNPDIVSFIKQVKELHPSAPNQLKRHVLSANEAALISCTSAWSKAIALIPERFTQERRLVSDYFTAIFLASFATTEIDRFAHLSTAKTDWDDLLVRVRSRCERLLSGPKTDLRGNITGLLKNLFKERGQGGRALQMSSDSILLFLTSEVVVSQTHDTSLQKLATDYKECILHRSLNKSGYHGSEELFKNLNGNKLRNNSEMIYVTVDIFAKILRYCNLYGKGDTT